MYHRRLPIKDLVGKKSLFLLGPRQTGKSTLLKNTFPDAPYWNLNAADTFRELARKPEIIRQTLPASAEIVIIDEIQRLPQLLNEVQLMIDGNPQLRFILTGSSARKLRRGNANLLAGRAWTTHLFPLIAEEVEFKELDKRLSIGSLPSILTSSDPLEELNAYVGTYLAEEIRAEGLSRSIEAFSRFLEVAGLCSGKQVNFTEVGNDAQVPPRTVREFYSVLEDTLIGDFLLPYQHTQKRKPVATAKFFLFDVGVANYLKKRVAVEQGSEAYGDVLEHQIFLELRAYLSYQRLSVPMTYWRTQTQQEVDFVVGDEVAIEVKATSSVSSKMQKSLLMLAEEAPLKKKIIVCNERHKRIMDNGIVVFPVEDFLRELWSGGII